MKGGQNSHMPVNCSCGSLIFSLNTYECWCAKQIQKQTSLFSPWIHLYEKDVWDSTRKTAKISEAHNMSLQKWEQQWTLLTNLVLYNAMRIKFLILTFFPTAETPSTVMKLSINTRPLSLDTRKSRPCAAAAILVIVPMSARTNWNSSEVSFSSSSL